jgi:hypothetical protein
MDGKGIPFSLYALCGLMLSLHPARATLLFSNVTVTAEYSTSHHSGVAYWRKLWH